MSSRLNGQRTVKGGREKAHRRADEETDEMLRLSPEHVCRGSLGVVLPGMLTRNGDAQLCWLLVSFRASGSDGPSRGRSSVGFAERGSRSSNVRWVRGTWFTFVERALGSRNVNYVRGVYDWTPGVCDWTPTSAKLDIRSVRLDCLTP